MAKNPLVNNKSIQYLKEVNQLFTDTYGIQLGRSLRFTGAASTASACVAIGKLVMGILSLSVFTCANAFYSFGMVFAKVIALRGISLGKDRESHYRHYHLSAVILMVSSVIFMIYSMRVFIKPIQDHYHMYVAIAIAAITFTEIGLNIRGVLMTRHNHRLLIHGIKMINLSGAFISLVLTQAALLSVRDQGVDIVAVTKGNGITGLLMGLAATSISVYMMVRVRKIKRQEEEVSEVSR